ncbi:MAG: acetyltransferase [Herbinix sp.]|jgi:predicted GNAT family acetyltransferase|nr:acetyltransferase [Herbinix sp.]
MRNYVKYTVQLSDFKPVSFKKVRWLNDDDYHYMNELWDMSYETWNEARNDGFTYCAVLEDNKIISVAAVWRYSQDKWEVAAVNTRENFENRGLAKMTVSCVADYILNQNRIPTLTTGEDNIPMRRVAEAVGFHLI